MALIQFSPVAERVLRNGASNRAAPVLGDMIGNYRIVAHSFAIKLDEVDDAVEDRQSDRKKTNKATIKVNEETGMVRVIYPASRTLFRILERREEELSLVQSDTQYIEVFNWLCTEEMFYLITRNSELCAMAFEKYAQVKSICLYNGKDCSYPCEILARLYWNDWQAKMPKIVKNRVEIETPDRYRLDLERVHNIHAIALMFDSVRTIEVVVKRFNYHFNAKVAKILTDYNNNSNNKLRRVVLIIEDEEERYHLDNLIRFIRTLKQCGIAELEIIHSATRETLSIEPCYLIEKIDVRHLRNDGRRSSFFQFFCM